MTASVVTTGLARREHPGHRAYDARPRRPRARPAAVAAAVRPGLRQQRHRPDPAARRRGVRRADGRAPRPAEPRAETGVPADVRAARRDRTRPGEVPVHRDHRQGGVRRLDHADQRGGRDHAPTRGRLDDLRHRTGGELAAARPGLGVRRPGARRAGRVVHRRHERRGRQEAEERAVQLRRRREGLGPAERADDLRRDWAASAASWSWARSCSPCSSGSSTRSTCRCSR